MCISTPMIFRGTLNVSITPENDRYEDTKNSKSGLAPRTSSRRTLALIRKAYRSMEER